MKNLLFFLLLSSAVVADGYPYIDPDHWFLLYDEPIMITEYYDHTYLVMVLEHDPNCKCKKEGDDQ